MKKKFSKILGVGLTLALLTSLLMTAAPVSAVSTPTVVLTGIALNPAYEISKDNIYTVTFTTGAKVLATEQIVVVFEAGTDITGMLLADIKIDTTAGLGGAVFTNVTPNLAAVAGTYPAAQTLTITPSAAAGPIIGTGAIVQLTIGSAATAYVTNPATPGTYHLTVATQTGATPAVAIEAAVTSTAFTIKVPTISPVPGVVKGYNVSDILLYEKTGATAINDAFAVGGVTKVVVGPGTYDEQVLNNVATVTSITSSDGAATTIIKGTNAGVTLSVKCTFDGFTVVGTTFGVKVDTVAGTTVKNCALSGATAGALDIDVGTTALPTISTGNTITVATADHGIDVAVGQVATSTNDIFTVAGTGKGIINNGTLTLTGATINGASGIGFESLNVAAVSTITGSTFSSLDTAILVTNGATVAVSSSTITSCGRVAVVGPPAVAALPAIDVATVATSVTIIGNTIADCVDEILEIDNVAGNSAKVFLNFNTITNPAKGIDNNEAAIATVDATNNWWGVATGPTVAMLPLSATTGLIDTTPFLVAVMSSPKLAVGAATLTGKTTVGVNVSVALAGGGASAPAVIGVASYASNPGTTSIPGTVLNYVDVYVGGPANTTDVVTISLFGTVTANTKAYVWGAGLGKWVECSTQAVNVFAGSITITVGTGTTPTLTDLAGLPLALVEPPAGALTAPDLKTPALGAKDVVLKPTLAWGTVAGAIGYDFELADNEYFVVPMVSLIGELVRLGAPFYAQIEELDYSKYYYWRVKAVSATAESAWNTGVFYTVAEPVEPAAEVWMCSEGLTFDTREALEEHLATAEAHQPVEPADIIVEPPDIIVPLPAETPITPAWIYAIIGVGAVLVIAVIVLIVRTRRVA